MDPFSSSLQPPKISPNLHIPLLINNLTPIPLPPLPLLPPHHVLLPLHIPSLPFPYLIIRKPSLLKSIGALLLPARSVTQCL